MEEKNATKISLSTFLLIIAIIAIIVMGVFIYKLNNDKTIEIQKSTELQAQVNSLKNQNNNLSGTINTLQENSSNEVTNNTVAEKSEKNNLNNNVEKSVAEYNKNFSNSVFNQLNTGTNIIVPIWAYCNYSELTINKNHEAFWNNQGNDTFPETSNTKVASNVVNAWYCPLGQDIESNGCLLFLKENGNVTYIRFYLDNSSTGNQFVNVTEEKTLNEISQISNVLVVEDGFYGALFIKEDGTTVPVSLTKLDELTNPK